MEAELDYEPENLDESSDPFATNPDDNSAECGVKSSCEDNLYGDFEVHENAEKLDDEITYDHSVNFDPLKTDLISPVDRMFEEDLHGKQTESNSQTLDEEFYIGKKTVGNTSDLETPQEEDNERTYHSSDEAGSTKRTRSREESESKTDRDHSRKRKTSSSQYKDDDGVMPNDGSSKKKRASSNDGGNRNREERSNSKDKSDNSNAASKHERIIGPEKSPGPTDDLKHESVSAGAERELWLKDLFKGTRFFMIKSRNDHNIMLAKEKSVWSTTPNNEPRLNKAFSNTRCVILLFSGAESQRFAGFARLASESSTEIPMPPWQIPPGMSVRALSGVFQLDWITKEELMFAKTTHLYNDWNLRKPVKIGRDGQEIEPGCAEKLCRLFDFSPDIDIYQIVKRMRAQEKMRSNRDSDPSGCRNREFDSRQTFPRHIHNRDHYGGDNRGYGGNSFYNRDRRGRSRSPFRGNGRPRSPYRGYNSGYHSRGGGYRYDYNNRNNYNQSTAGSNSNDNRNYGADKGDEPSSSSQKPNNEPGVPAANPILDPFGEVSRETMLHGSYGDYMREFQKQMQRVYPGFPGPFPPPFMGMQFYPPFGMPPPMVASAPIPQQSTSSSSRMDDIDTHAKLVDKFLRKTRRRSDSSASRSQSRSRSRSKSRSGYDDGNYASEDDRADSYSDSNSVDYHDSGSRRRRDSEDRSGRHEYISNRTRRSSSGNSDDREIQYSSRSAQRRY